VASSNAVTSSRLQTIGSLRLTLGLATSVSNQGCFSVRVRPAVNQAIIERR
jgi:hypothetical protein